MNSSTLINFISRSYSPKTHNASSLSFIEDNSFPPPIVIHQNHFLRRHSLLPILQSHPSFDKDTIFDDTFEITLNDSPIHKTWQSTSLCPPIPQPLKLNYIPITSVNDNFNQLLENPPKDHSCRYPSENV